MWVIDIFIIEESFIVICYNVLIELFVFEGNSGGKGGRKEVSK